ncbi:MAG TPA: hypothetical protein VFE47_20015 [Tepidisphaeraceae bacterium]|jgi:hypothetical protein|nr:hypothetical protein [Tepidisphaeraceae bacterium]
MRRINLPPWARPPVVDSKDVNDRGNKQLDAMRSLVLSAVQDAVQGYIDDVNLVFDRESDGFPAREMLTGDYYIGDEDRAPGATYKLFHLWVMARCIGICPTRHKPDDYLGLNILLDVDCDEGTAELMGVDSSVI